MQLTKLFVPVESMNPDQAREFMAQHEQGTYTLLDVRQPGEYEDSRIPGATLIPLPGLLDSLDRLDPEKPTLVYCAIGGRSRVAAQLLSGRGFKRPINLAGGINAWEGLKAAGPVEMDPGLIWADTPEAVIMTSYSMEHALSAFYRAMQSRTADRPVADLLGKLAGVEEKHKQYLVDLYNTIDPTGIDKQALEKTGSAMEGGFDPNLFMSRNEQFIDSPSTLLDLAMMLETQALDLYIRLADTLERRESKEVFFKIADEEKVHLRALGRLKEEVH